MLSEKDRRRQKRVIKAHIDQICEDLKENIDRMLEQPAYVDFNNVGVFAFGNWVRKEAGAAKVWYRIHMSTQEERKEK